MPNTPSHALAGEGVELWLPHSIVAARFLVQPGPEANAGGIQPLSLAPEFEIEAAQRRAAIAGDEALGAQPGGAVGARLFEQQSHQRLDAAEQHRRTAFGVAAVEGGDVGAEADVHAETRAD